MKNKFVLILLLSFLMTKCASPKFYNEIKSTYPAYKEGKRHFKNDVNKIVLKYASKYLEYSQHIIYFEAEVASINLDDKNYKIVIWDVKKNKYYYLSYYEGKIFEDKHPKLEYFNFVYKYFEKDNCAQLIEYGEKSGQSGIRVPHSIYEVDLVNKAVRECTFLDIILINGLP